MRLGAFLLGFLVVPLVAQGHPSLPWELSPALAWRVGLGAGAEEDPSNLVPANDGHFMVKLNADGTLRILGPKGLRRLRMGLPGRPLRAWRDAGIPLDLSKESWRFPADTPLSRGFQALPWAGEDFRAALKGVVWILDDGERFLTVVHPATARVVYLPLPPGHDLSVRMTPGYLQLLENSPDGSSEAPRRWSLPWVALIPQFAKLARPEETLVQGSALIPFPK